MIHVWHLSAHLLDKGWEAIDEIGRYILVRIRQAWLRFLLY